MNPLEKMVVERLERRADKIRQDFIRDQLIGWQEAYLNEKREEELQIRVINTDIQVESKTQKQTPKIVIKAAKITKTIKRLKRKSYSPEQYISYKFQSYITRSEKKEIPFQLTKSEFILLLEGHCSYCGKIPAGTIDRIDSKAGYTIINSQPACFRCNVMKYTFSDQEFRSHINKIYNKIKKKRCPQKVASVINYTLW